MNRSALDKLKDLAAAMMELGLGESNHSARTIREDPEWDNMARNRECVTSMWEELHDAVTAEVGSGLTRRVPHWNVDWEPIIIVGAADEFDDDYDEDQPFGWTPLAKAHRREAGWDFSPRYEAATWIGWWEPESSIGSGENVMVTGLLPEFNQS